MPEEQIIIENIKLSASAYFYKVKNEQRIDERMWKLVCGTIRDAKNISRSHFFKTSWKTYQPLPDGDVAYYGVCAFLLPDSKAAFAKDINGFWAERRTGYAILMEYKGYVALFKRNTPTLKPLVDALDPIDYKRITTLHSNATITKVSMRNLAAAEHAIQAKSYEAKDLQVSMPYVGTSHYSIRSLRGTDGNTMFGIVPSTSKVGVSETWKLPKCLDWAISTIDDLAHPAPNNNFISLFADAIDYRQEEADLVPSSLLLHIGRLKELIENVNVAITYTKGKTTVDRGVLNTYFDVMAERLLLLTPCAEDGTYKTNSGDIILHKTPQRIFLTDNFWQIITIDSDSFSGTLEMYINEQQLFNVYFDDTSLIYSNSTLFRDNKLGSSTSLLNALDCMYIEGLSTVSSEKEGNSSIFSKVEEKFANQNVFLICDDYGTEWADHILIEDGRIVFFVEKCKKKAKQSASALQDVVGQALKNLGNFTPSVNALHNKRDNIWSNPHPITGKKRLICTPNEGASIHDAVELWKTNMNNPLLQKEMCIVVNFISKGGFERDLNNRNATSDIKATVYQRLWILSSFVNTCLEVGVKPIIYCVS